MQTDGWLDDVLKCIQKIEKKVFSCEDVYEVEEYLANLQPNNNNVRAKIRQQLQLLRDDGKIDFIDNNGHYQKLK